MNTEEKYNTWYAEVNEICKSKLMVDLADLPNMPFADAFSNGTTPQDFASYYLDMGYLTDGDYVGDYMDDMLEDDDGDNY